MAFNGTEGGNISPEEAAALTAKFRNANPGAVIAQYIGRDIIETILAQEGCVGLRIYNGINENNEPKFVIVGVDANENDQVNGTLADRTYNCPTACSDSNFLNGY